MRPINTKRFWEQVEKTTKCWFWRGPTFYNRRYGAFANTTAHRVSYILANGELPKDIYIHHICRNKLCVRPDHLSACSREDHLRHFHPELKIGTRRARWLGRRGAKRLRQKYGPGYWKRIRAGEKPSKDKER